ncbi:Integrase, catalytic core [Gossypium australe]|uniref:Integrase, catalytic core n=1 Tax=Gossypium australe TaxID=47621 RepID=A0A5B6WVY1_9ROSI|nr:Integrase, catalytic core [Gossypium australe]
MLGYDYEIVYRKGSNNVAVDALSRVNSITISQLRQLTGVTVVSELLSKVQALYLSDPKLHKLCAEVQNQSSPHPKKGKIMVGNNEEIRRAIFQHFHASAIGGHSGVVASGNRMASLLY